VRLIAVSGCLLAFLTIPLLVRALFGHDQEPKQPLPS